LIVAGHADQAMSDDISEEDGLDERMYPFYFCTSISDHPYRYRTFGRDIGGWHCE
jgi:hypothetical protein